MKKIVITFLILSFVGCFSSIVCAQELQTTQEPSKELLKGKAGAFARIEKTVSTIKAIASEFRQERRLAMLKEPVVSSGRFYYENRTNCAGNLSALIPPVFSLMANLRNNGRERIIPRKLSTCNRTP